jgi:hypothetical protein
MGGEALSLSPAEPSPIKGEGAVLRERESNTYPCPPVRGEGVPTRARAYRLRANFRKHFGCLGGCMCRPRMVRRDELCRSLPFLGVAKTSLQLPV